MRLPGSAGMENRYMYLRLPFHDVSIETLHDEKTGDPVIALRIVGRRGGNMMISLTALTPDELAAFKTVLQVAFDLGEPIAQALYEEALEIENDGGTPLDRIYRTFPPVVVRSGALDKYSSGVLQRRPNAVPGVPDLVLPERAVVQSGRRLAQQDKAGDAAGNVPQANGGLERVLGMVGAGEDPPEVFLADDGPGVPPSTSGPAV